MSSLRVCLSYLHPIRTLSLCRCGTDAVPTRKTLPKNFDVAGTEQRLYDWYEEAFVLPPFGLHIAQQACLSVPCNQQADSQIVTWQVGAKRHVPAKKHRLWRAVLHGYATPKCDWQAAHGSCHVCYLARHHDALCQDVRQTHAVVAGHRPCRHCYTGLLASPPTLVYASSRSSYVASTC